MLKETYFLNLWNIKQLVHIKILKKISLCCVSVTFSPLCFRQTQILKLIKPYLYGPNTQSFTDAQMVLAVSKESFALMNLNKIYE